MFCYQKPETFSQVCKQHIDVIKHSNLIFFFGNDINISLSSLFDHSLTIIGYLGTDPTLHTATVANVRSVNYQDTDKELATLNSTIKEYLSKGILKSLCAVIEMDGSI